MKTTLNFIDEIKVSRIFIIQYKLFNNYFILDNFKKVVPINFEILLPPKRRSDVHHKDKF